jgi:hypothetical protein
MLKVLNISQIMDNFDIIKRGKATPVIGREVS